MVGEHNIKVSAVLTHQASLLGWVRPRPVIVGSGGSRDWWGCRLVGIVNRAGFRCATLTSGIRAKGRKNLGNHLQGHMVTGESVNLSRGSRGWLWPESWTRSLHNFFGRSHGWLWWKSWTQCVTEEIVRFSPTSGIDGERAQHKGGGSPHPSG
jgi:hypothetical protein